MVIIVVPLGCTEKDGKYQVWRYDIVFERSADGRSFRTLTVMDEFRRECLAIRVTRQLRAHHVLSDVHHSLPVLLASPQGARERAPAWPRQRKYNGIIPAFND